MATLDDVHQVRWHLVNATVPYNASFGIPTFWRAHPELGSPIGPEQDLGDGIVAQAFTGGIVRYTPGSGAEIVTE